MFFVVKSYTDITSPFAVYKAVLTLIYSIFRIFHAEKGNSQQNGVIARWSNLKRLEKTYE